MKEIEEMNVNAGLAMAKAARMQEEHDMFQDKLEDIKALGAHPSAAIHDPGSYS